MGIGLMLPALALAAAMTCGEPAPDGATTLLYLECWPEMEIVGTPRPETGTAIEGRPRVIDGDTIDIGDERIRLQGVDTPERGQRCRDAAGDEYRCGRAATEALKARIGTEPVRCEIEGRGKYGRAIGTCFTPDGTDLNGWLVRRGYGLAYRKYSQRYIAAEEAARAEGLGMHTGRFVPPWDWRKGKRLTP